MFLDGSFNFFSFHFCSQKDFEAVIDDPERDYHKKLSLDPNNMYLCPDSRFRDHLKMSDLVSGKNTLQLYMINCNESSSDI